MPGMADLVSFDFDTDPNLDDIQNLGRFTDADYELKYDGTDYIITNLNTKVSKTLTALDNTFEGLRFDLGKSTLAAGEKALIQPTRYMARGIAMAINDPRQIAAGCPVIGFVPLSNAGTGKISDITMSNVDGVLGAWDLELVYNAGNLSLTFNPPPPGGFGISPSNTFNPAADAAGKTFTVTVAGGYEFSFTLSGTPQDGDTFNMHPTEAGVADNRNANLLVALQTAKLLFNNVANAPTATMDSAYSQLVNKVGNKTHEVQVNELTQTMLYAQACEARDSFSAVNLDEEAANLVRYQQAYQASGRVMSIAQRLFDEIISIVR
jgi:flagellar hook-associated protein 1 FlgK